MKKLIILIFVLLGITIFSCNKTQQKCRFVELDAMQCEKGYSKIDNAIVYEGLGYFNCDSGKIIYDETEYDSIFNNENPFGYIDFNTKILIGKGVKTNLGRSVEYQSWVCINSASGRIIMNIEYSLEDQCQGSNLQKFYLGFWAVVPHSSYVDFNVVDINPY